MRTLDWTFAAQVSNTMLGDDDFHRVLAMVLVANHWHEGRDSTALSSRWSGIDADICVASKVARTTDTIHHLGTTYVDRVDVCILNKKQYYSLDLPLLYVPLLHRETSER